MLKLPTAVRQALCRLEENGYEAYIVGGCVRDSLLGKEPQDYDITTSAKPEETIRVFSGFRVIETGLKHGTVTVLSDGMPLEITTYRTETTYSDHRHPDAVQFAASLREDLVRRDFTVNAMACSVNGDILDYYGGREDLKAGLIRCVGSPDERFQEDALRILRALRFSSTLNFRIEEATAAAVHRNRELLREVSAERVFSELKKLLCGTRAGEILTEYPDVFGVFLPCIPPMAGFEQRNPHHIYDVLTHTAHVVDAIAPEPVLRLAALFHDSGKPCCFTLDEAGIGHFYGHPKYSAVLCEEALTALRADTAAKETVIPLVRYHDILIETTEKAVRRALNRFGEEQFFRLMQLKRADNLAQSPSFRDRQVTVTRLEELARDILDRQLCFSMKDLALKGSDLTAMGLKPGPEIGRLLQLALDAVLDGTAENEKEELIRLVKDRITTEED